MCSSNLQVEISNLQVEISNLQVEISNLQVEISKTYDIRLQRNEKIKQLNNFFCINYNNLKKLENLN